MNSSDERQRRFRITIRLSLAERQMVDQAAARAGITRSSYARQVILGAKPPRSARRPSVDVCLLVSLLDRLGVDYVEGGYPGANPLDTEFFKQKPTRHPAML